MLAILVRSIYDDTMTQDMILQLLSHLPFRVSFYSATNELIYSNNASDGSFFPEDEPEQLPDWLWSDILSAKEKGCHLEIASDSFELKLMQSYQAIYNQSSELMGVISYIQDIQPVLASYLEASGQALVGWSDTTSGPSISNDSITDSTKN